MSKETSFSHEADIAFQESYQRLAVHEKMLKDDIRTRSYMNAMIDNPALFQDKIVADIGCGTGILSMFAAKAGAKHVYAVDQSSMIEKAQAIAEMNNLSDQITFVKGKAEDVVLPEVDIIVSEWMGFYLLSEFMLDCVLRAKDRWLKPGGLMMPDKFTLYIAAIEDAQLRKEKVDYWDNIYGLNYSAVKPIIFSTGYLTIQRADTVITDSACIAELDFRAPQFSISTLTDIPFELTAKREGSVHAFLTWFDYGFTAGPRQVQASTGPFSTPTHWKQTIFFIETSTSLSAGNNITGKVSFEQNDRDLNLHFQYSLGEGKASGSGIYKVECIEA